MNRRQLCKRTVITAAGWALTPIVSLETPVLSAQSAEIEKAKLFDDVQPPASGSGYARLIALHRAGLISTATVVNYLGMRPRPSRITYSRDTLFFEYDE